MIRAVPLRSGGMIALAAGVDAWRTDTGYLVAPPHRRPFLISADEEGAIDAQALADLKRRGGTRVTPLLAENLPLAEAVYGWATDAEVSSIIKVLGVRSTSGLGLEVACGYGRLLLPLQRAGLRLDGIDHSSALTRNLHKRLPGTGSRLFCAPWESFSAPGAYDWIIAANDALREIDTLWALRTHLNNMSDSLAPGGQYLVNLKLHPRPSEPYCIRRTVSYEATSLDVSWRFIRYHHLKRKIAERMVVTDRESGTFVHEEEKLLLGLNAADFLDTLQSTPGLSMKSTFENDLTPELLDQSDARRVWILLERSGVE